MKKPQSARPLIAAAFLLSAAPALAQPTVVAFAEGSNLFFAVIAGVLIAIGLQLVLTNLSVAIGANAAAPKNKDRSGDEPSDAGPSAWSTAKKSVSAMGLWALVTVSLSLFFACWLAAAVSGVATLSGGILMGLTIWAAFFIAAVVLESKAAASLIGALAQTARQGFESVRSAASGLFSPSEPARAGVAAEKIAQAVKAEVFGSEETRRFTNRIETWVDRLSPPSITPAEIRAELEKLLERTEVEAVAQHGENMLDASRIEATLKRKKGLSSEQRRQMAGGLKSAIGDIRDEMSKSKSPVDKMIDAANRMAGKSPAEASAVRERFEHYLRNTQKASLDPDGIKKDLERLINDRRGGSAALKSRLGAIDRATIVAALEQRPDVSHEEAEQRAARINDVISEVRRRFGGGSDDESPRDVSPNAVRDKINEKIDEMIARMPVPAVDELGFKSDLQDLFHDPQLGARELLDRLRAIDRETIRAVVAKNSRLSEDDAERLMQRMEDVRNRAVERAETAVSRIEQKLSDARSAAIEQANQARKVAATAAWWSFGTATVAAVAAVVGATIGMTPL